MSGLSSLYREAIRHHAAEPVGFRQSIAATHRKEVHNPQCGDRIEMHLRIVDGTVEAAAFDGEACAICMASASLLCAAVPGHPVNYLRELNDFLHAALTDDPHTGGAGGEVAGVARPGVESADPAGADVIKPLLGVRPYPSRIRCATLPWAAAVGAL